MNPMCAEDWDPEKVKFPIGMQPKIDGVRGWNPYGKLLARSMNPHDNVFTTAFFSEDAFAGFDGELAAEHHCHPRLCSLTTSAVGTIAGTPYVLWWLFDLVTPETMEAPYEERYRALQIYVEALREDVHLAPKVERLRVVPFVIAHNMEALMMQHEQWCKDGYEGSILRGLNGKHKQGRSSPTQGGLLRIKNFQDDEGVVIGLIEGRENLNPATINARGRSERSSHAENMVPNGKIGTIIIKTLKDIVVNNGKKTIPAGTIQHIGAGAMDHQTRVHLLQHPEEIDGKIIKFKHFPKGVKESLRFANFHSFRSPNDL